MKREKRFAAMLLSGLLIMGVLQGSVFAAQTENCPTQITEKGKTSTSIEDDEVKNALAYDQEFDVINETEDSAGVNVHDDELQQGEAFSINRDYQQMDAAVTDDADVPGGEENSVFNVEVEKEETEESAAATDPFEAPLSAGIEETQGEVLGEGFAIDPAEEAFNADGNDTTHADASEPEMVKETPADVTMIPDSTDPADNAAMEEEVSAAGEAKTGEEDAGKFETSEEAVEKESATEEAGALGETQAPALNSEEEKEIHITYDANGGYFYGSHSYWDGDERIEVTNPTVIKESVWVSDGSSAVTRPPIAVTIDDPEKIIVGWSKTKDGDAFIEGDGQFTPEEDCILYAVYGDCYSVTLDANGGSYDLYDSEKAESVQCDTNYAFKVLKGEKIALPDAGDFYYQVKTGDAHKKFRGWGTEKEGGFVKLEDGEYTPTGNVTLYAVWKDSYVVTVDANGGYFKTVWDDVEQTLKENVSRYSMKVAAGDLVSFFPTAIEEDSSRVNNEIATPEYDDPEVTSLQYSLSPDGEPVVYGFNNYVPTEDCTLYAVREKAFTVTLDANGGYFPYETGSYNEETGETDRVTVYKEKVLYGNEMRISNSWFEMACDEAGRTFLGWSLSKTGKPLEDQDWFRPQSSCTLYALWSGQEKKVTSIILDKTNSSVMKGKTVAVKVKAVVPSDADNKSVKWTSGNTKIATVTQQGVVKGLAKGTVTITAEAQDGSGVKAACKVTVRQPVTKITLARTSLILNRGKTSTIQIKSVAPSSANNKAVKWISSNTKVVSVTQKGVVKGLAKGTATITATAKDGSGVKAACRITVRQPVTSLKISKTKVTLTKGKTVTLKVTAAPSNADNKAVTWKTSNKKVATVTAKGAVKGIGKGTAVITATARDVSGKKVTCRVTVK